MVYTSLSPLIYVSTFTAFCQGCGNISVAEQSRSISKTLVISLFLNSEEVKLSRLHLYVLIYIPPQTSRIVVPKNEGWMSSEEELYHGADELKMQHRLQNKELAESMERNSCLFYCTSRIKFFLEFQNFCFLLLVV